MKYTFICRYMPEKGMKPWTGTITPMLPFEPRDFEVCARDSMFRIIIGGYSCGRYMCIPNWNIGMEIVDPDDCLWNYGHLISAYPNLNRVDAISIINALAAIKHYDDACP